MSHSAVIIGAGPYGLSIAAHLKACGIDFRIFGTPMQTWRTEMPVGMHLKSEGFASTLWDPERKFTLAHYCTAEGIPYADTGLPVSLETFWRYGLAFQQRFAPELENRTVTKVESIGREFRLSLDDGSTVDAKRVIVASGLANFAHMPSELANAPKPYVTHSSAHNDLSELAGKDVIVLGAGASALDCAALLHQAGASVQLVARQHTIRFHSPPLGRPRRLLERIRAPMSGLGPGWRSRLCTDAPLAFHCLPEHLRLKIVRRHLGPAPCWWTNEQVANKVPLHLGMQLKGACVRSDRIELDLADENGAAATLSADRVIAATGFKVDLGRLPFLDASLAARIRRVERSPVLSTNFESSVPGLYFVGVASAASFGPMMRFAFGAGYTARRLTWRLARDYHPAAPQDMGLASKPPNLSLLGS